MGIAFSSAIAVSVIAIVLSLLGCLLLIFSVVILIGALRSRRLIAKGKKKAYAAWQIVSAVFIFVITLLPLPWEQPPTFSFCQVLFRLA